MISFLPSRATWRSMAMVVATGLLVASCGSGVSVVGDQWADRTSRIKPARSQFTAIYPHDFAIHGIDVSKYQGDIDWQAVRSSGVRFAYIKATEGNEVDPKFYQNWQGAKAAGVQRGAYHFAFWCRSPREEINNFIQSVPVDPDALPPVLDVEATPKSRACRRTLDRAETIADMRRMLAELERAYGKRPVIYTTVDFYEAILSPNELNDYPIWVRSTKYSPHVHYAGRRWHFWQYQSDGQVPGIRGYVDRNAFNGDARQWMAFAGGERVNPTAYAETVPAVSAPAPTPVARSLPPMEAQTVVAAAPMAPAARPRLKGDTTGEDAIAQVIDEDAATPPDSIPTEDDQ